jgi:branched-chain amino acid aminotransferase
LGHVASLSQLQKPAWALVNGELVPYEDVRIHISAEALTRALSVFEGIKGYWNSAGDVFAIRTPHRHYQRLRRSAALLHIPVTFSYQEFVDGLRTLAAKLLVPEKDLWFRATLYVTQGHWGEGTVADLVVTAFTQQKSAPDAMGLGVSTWRRAADVALPTRIKSSANYLGGRLARIEVGRLGYDEAVMLNDAGRVAETSGACILIADGGRVITPPASEGCLDSITVDVLEMLSRTSEVPFERRPIERTELLAAQECAIAGTITALTMVSEVDGFHYEQAGVLAGIRERYIQLMRQDLVLPGVELLPLVHEPAQAVSH